MSSLKLVNKFQQGLKELSEKLGKFKNPKFKEMEKRIKKINNKIKEKFSPRQKSDKED